MSDLTTSLQLEDCSVLLHLVKLRAALLQGRGSGGTPHRIAPGSSLARRDLGCHLLAAIFILPSHHIVLPCTELSSFSHLISSCSIQRLFITMTANDIIMFLFIISTTTMINTINMINDHIVTSFVCCAATRTPAPHPPPPCLTRSRPAPQVHLRRRAGEYANWFSWRQTAFDTAFGCRPVRVHLLSWPAQGGRQES